jgi:hypothetical protein
MKTVLGLIMVIAGIAVGLYFGVYVMFIGGIIDIVDYIKQDLTTESLLVWGIVKIMFSGVVGWLAGLILLLPGLGFIKN